MDVDWWQRKFTIVIFEVNDTIHIHIHSLLPSQGIRNFTLNWPDDELWKPDTLCLPTLSSLQRGFIPSSTVW